MENSHFNTLVVITPNDCQRIINLYPRLVSSINYGRISFVGPSGLSDIIHSDSFLKDHVSYINEDSIIPFDEVHNCVKKRLANILGGRDLPRGVTGWYYQQFLKMKYSQLCDDEYYMVWDGDTIPCRQINMFQEGTGKPYLDLKHELHPEYFETMNIILPGFTKVIGRSFISEHMLIKADIMRDLINTIESNDSIEGSRFWEKIINAIPEEKIQNSSFSEFETYGTFVALKYPDIYILRDWHSFRLGGCFFNIDTIADKDFDWLSRDFYSISFEKGHTVNEDVQNLFDNPRYQEKLSPKQMLQIVQEEFKEGYKEVWAEDVSDSEIANTKVGAYGSNDENN